MRQSRLLLVVALAALVIVAPAGGASMTRACGWVNRTDAGAVSVAALKVSCRQARAVAVASIKGTRLRLWHCIGDAAVGRCIGRGERDRRLAGAMVRWEAFSAP